jgi:zinc protease
MQVLKSAAAIVLAALISSVRPAAQPRTAPISIDYHKLDNGLKVVLVRDSTSPTAVVGMYYRIGFRVEPRNRTGFAHLFEHLMFQGSQHLGKNAFIGLVQSNGGILNGSTRFDFTNYYEVVPSNTVQTILWGEADRMRGLDITEQNLTNQRAVVENEVKVNVLNRPYGGFPWLDLPQVANTNWYNAHNFYGDFAELDAATLGDVSKFFKTYYAPNNAALVVTGDIDPVQTLAWIKEYFGPIPSASVPPQPDISEPRQEREKRVNHDDALATRPAIAVGYHVPKRGTPEWFAMGLIDQILVQGEDSRLYQSIVQQQGLAGDVNGGINPGLGNMFDVDGPILWTVSLIHDADKTDDRILQAIDTEVQKLESTPVTRDELALANTKMRSSLYAEEESLVGFGRANLLASFALFDDDPSKINHIEEEFEKVTPELIQKTTREYLRPTNRTILSITPKQKSSGEDGGGAR